MKRLDLVDKTFGRLTVKKFSHVDKSNRTMWECNCTCGCNVIAQGHVLMRGGKNSCGCLLKEFQNRLPAGESNRNDLYRTYKTHAKNRKLNFEITVEKFGQLNKEPCFFCGCQPYQIHKDGSFREGYIYNGIDRLDNSIGYTDKNCVPCCGKCNWLKGSMSFKDLLEKVKLIYDKHIK